MRLPDIWRRFLKDERGGGGPMFTLDQTHSRFRNDDGSETGATWVQIEDTDPVTLDVDTIYRIRLVIQETAGAAGAESFQFQYDNTTQGTGFTDITTTSSHVRAVASADTSWTISDGDATTDQIGGTGGFQAGEMIEDGASNSATNFAASEHTEMELVFQIQSADVADGDQIDIRVTNQMGQALDAYSHTPTIDVNEAAPPATDLTGIIHRTGHRPGPGHGLTRFYREDIDPPQPIPFKITHKTGADKTPLDALNLTRFTRPDEPPPPPTIVTISETGHDVRPGQPNLTRVAPLFEEPAVPETDLTQLVHRTGHELGPDTPNLTRVAFDFGDVPQPIPFDLTAKRTGAARRADQPNLTRLTQPEEEPPAPPQTDLTGIINRTGHAPRPGQVNASRFIRPDALEIVTNLIDILETGHEPRPGRVNVTRFTRPGPETPPPVETDLTQLTHRTGHEPAAGQRNLTRLIFNIDDVPQPVPPKLTHITGHRPRPDAPNEPRFVEPVFLPVAQPIPPELVHRTGVEARPGQRNETRFTQPTAAPVVPFPDELWWFLVHRTGADRSFADAPNATRFALAAAVAGPPSMTQPIYVGPNQGEPRVATPDAPHQVGSTPAPTRTRPGGGRTRVGS